MAGAEPCETTSQARLAWNLSDKSGELEWLQDSTFISADCFKPPHKSVAQPRIWDRISVPTAIGRQSGQKIYKRVSAPRCIDRKYRAVIAELESQGLEGRKRPRITGHIVPYGSAGFKPEMRPDVAGDQDLAEARDQVKGALQNIWRDNLRLQNAVFCRRNKRSSFDPAQLVWIPRKRHNTRWPINPPGQDTEFIAALQPLIKFELHPSQVDELAYENSIEQNDVRETDALKTGPQQNGVHQSSRVPEPEEPARLLKREKSGQRRRTLRPSLSTISEDIDETTVLTVLTSTPNRLVHASPAKRWKDIADKSKTPTKIAESPLKNFTLAATPNAADIRVTNESGHCVVPTSPITDADCTSACSAPVEDVGQSGTAPSPCTASTTISAPVRNDEEHSTPFRHSDRMRTVSENPSIYVTALPFFDQPFPDVQIEPVHESRRRISLHNARRSDRSSNVRVMRRVHNWMTGASVGKKRRHSDIGALQEHKISKRRHTLDVDAGLNPDIFGQLKAFSTSAEKPPKPGETLLGPVEILQQQSPKISTGPSEEAPTRLEKTTAEDDIQALLEDEANVDGDSDMAYLQSFVQRSRSSKEVKREDALTAPVLLKSFSKKRRSGSMNSATSDAGSPMAKMAATPTTTTNPSLRVPLGEKDANKSPSPSKKRKLKGVEDATAHIKKTNGRLVAPDLDDLQPATNKRKKRRKGFETDTDDVFNPDMDFNQVLTQRSTAGGAGARRSTRIATTHKPEPAPINVRVPGGVFVDNGDMPVVSTAGITNAVLQRKVDQDLANKTRANTRKNRGGAVPVQMALASMAEHSGNDDADEVTTTATDFVGPKVGRSGGVKTVRWDATLARIQGEEEPVTVASAVELEECRAEAQSYPELEDQEVEDEEEDTQLPSPPQLRVVNLPSPGADRPGNPVANQLSTDNNELEEQQTAKSIAPVRRSSRAATVSRLPKRGGGVNPASAPLVPMPTPKPKAKRSSLPAPSRISKSGGFDRAAAAGAAEARARLGMAGPGTPAPRRGGRRGGRR